MSLIGPTISNAALIYMGCGPHPESSPGGESLDSGHARRMARRRRVFELLVVILGMPVWLPVVTVCAMVLWLTNGPPVLYHSSRRVYRDQRATVYKFRTMVRNAEAFFNRRTVPVESQRFLNIPLSSPAYTKVGRLIERCSFTELPQLFQVLTGTMALVGNRPLPEDVIAALKESFPGVEARFWARSGVIGAAQLVGREELTDEQRLEIEIAFARVCLTSSSILLSMTILVEGILIAAGVRSARDFESVCELMRTAAN